MAVSLEGTEVILPSSRDEAVRAFGDGTGITVVAGGTIVVPEITHGRLRPQRAMLLGNAGLAGIRQEAGRTIVGAMTPVADLTDCAEPLASTARRVADVEIRAQATLGGNLCAPPGIESPRGDLQAALIALGARVRSVGADGERTEDVEDFLSAGPRGRLVLEVHFEDPESGATAIVRRPHAHAYTVLSACVARAGGVTRVGVSGAGPRAVRCHAVERALADGADAAAAAERVLDDITPHDDALASAWYRSRTLPGLVRRALNDLR